MKKLVLLFVLVLIGFAINAQDFNPQKGSSSKVKDSQYAKITKEEKATLMKNEEWRKQKMERAMETRPSLTQDKSSKATIFYEDFETSDPPYLPTGWTLQTVSNTYGWESEDWYWGYNNSWYYAISFWDDEYTRNEWMFSPAFALTEGTEYKVSFWVIAGYDYGDGDRLQVRLAQSPTVTAMNAGVNVFTNTNLFTDYEWEKKEYTFTASATGNWYLGFRAYTAAYDGDEILIDDVTVESLGGDPPLPPTGDCNDAIAQGNISDVYTGPVYWTYNNSYSQQIYTAAELGGAGQITKISYEYILATAKTPPVVIYIGHTTKNEFSAASAGEFIPAANLQKVFDGTVAFSNANQWTEITLDTPFEYNGIDNVVVAVVSNRLTGWFSGYHFKANNAANKHLYAYSDSYIFNTTDNPGPGTANVSRVSDRSNIIIKVCTEGGGECVPTEVTIASPDVAPAGSNSYQHPCNNLWNYSYCQMIYTSEEVGDAGEISSLSFKWATGVANMTKTNQKIFLGNTTKSTFASAGAGEWIALSDLQEVWAGSVTYTTGWVTIEFDSPFQYTGGNLVVAYLNSQGTYNYFTGFCTHNVSQKVISVYRDSPAPIDPANPTAGSPSSQYPTNRPDIKFDICVGGSGGACNPVTNLQVNYTPGCDEATLTWNAPAGKSKSVVVPFEPQKTDPALLKNASAEERTAREIDMAKMGISEVVHTVPTKGGKAVVLSESFSSPVLPSGWTTLDVDGDGYTWQFTLKNQGCGDIYPDGRGGVGDYCINSASYYNCVGTLWPNNWLITPQLALDGSAELTYWVKAFDVLYPADHYGVYVSTTGTNPSDFTLLFQETLTSAQANWTQRTVAIPQSGNCYIAFRQFNGNDQYIMLIDDIIVTTGGTIPPPTGDFTYNIYRNDDLIGTSTTTSFSDMTFNPAEAHTWSVTVACEGGGESVPAQVSKPSCGVGACDPAENLTAKYTSGCVVKLNWDEPSGGKSGGIGGGKNINCITTPTSNNGSGAVTVDITAGSQPVTITSIETPFTTAGASVVYMYYREGSACGYALSSAGWTHIGNQSITITSTGNGNNTLVALPTPVTIPAGATYGFYFAAPNAPGGGVRYEGTGTVPCGTTTIASNSDLTLKGGHGITGVTAPFTGSVNSERKFAGNICYTVGGGGGVICNDIQLGNGSTGTCRYPLNSFYNYSYSQQIFETSFLEANNIFAGATITSVSLEWFYGTPFSFNDVKVYMGTTTKASFASTSDWVAPNSLQLVCTKATQPVNNSQKWTTIEFTEPFVYTGGNIILAMSNGHTAYLTSNDVWRTHATTGGAFMTMQYQNDGTAFNMSSPQAAFERYAFRNNVLFNVCTSSGLSYNIYRGTDLIAFNHTETEYIDYDVNPDISNTWRVRVVCEGGGLSNAINASLLSCDNYCLPPENLEIEYTEECGAMLSWEDFGKKKALPPLPDVEVVEKVRESEGNIMSTVSSFATADPRPKADRGLQTFEPTSDGRGPSTLSYAIDCYPSPNSAATVPLNNPGALTYLGGSFSGALIWGGDWINGEWYCVNASPDYAPNIFKINTTTGVYSIVAQCQGLPNRPAGMAYHESEGQVYINLNACDNGDFYKLDINTGATQYAFTSSNAGICDFVITSDGRFIGFVLPNSYCGTTAAIVEVDPATGACTTLFSASALPISPQYVQGLAIDRETNMIYWAAYNSSISRLYSIDLAGTITNLGDFPGQPEIGSLAIPTIGNPNIAKAPTNVSLTPKGTSLSGTFSWTNPNQTVGGSPLTSITKMEVRRNGQWYQDMTGVTPGQSMSIPITVSTAGTHSFSVHAVTSEGNGSSGSASAVFGSVCMAEVIITATSFFFGDGFSWRITDDETGAVVAGAGQQVTGSNASAGTFPVMLFGDATFQIWQHTYSDNDGSVTVNVGGEQVYYYSGTFTSGFNQSADMPCAGSGLYNIYRDDELIAEGHKGTSYYDLDFDPTVSHVWCITKVCENDESEPVCMEMEACSCDPVENLEANYTADCEVMLYWDAATGGGKKSVTVGDPEFGRGETFCVTTPVASNGYGAVTLDIIAGDNPITITGFEAPFWDNGATTIYMYYRPGSACGYAQNASGWIHIGNVSTTIVGGGYTNMTPFELPTPVTIPAGEMYGFYIAAPQVAGGRICYHNGGSVCGTTTVSGSNADLTIKGGTAVTSPTAPFVGGSAFSERNFSGKICYTVGGVTYNVYRDGVLIASEVDDTYYLDKNNTPFSSHTYCVSVNCATGKESPKTCTYVTPCPYLGSLIGRVTNSVTTLPVSGAELNLLPVISPNINPVTYTNTNGNYSYANVISDKDYNIFATRHGYYDKFTDSFFIEQGEVNVFNFEMIPVPEFSVYGVVKASNDILFIEGAIVKLEGYDNYQVLTDELGVFDIPFVYMDDEYYTITVSAAGYQTYTAQVLISGHTNLGTIYLLDIPVAPKGVVAEEMDDKESVHIYWEAPGTPGGTTIFRYDNGTRDEQIGFTGGTTDAVVGSVHRVSANLTSMSWYLSGAPTGGGPHGTVYLRIFDLNSSGNPTSTVLFSKANHPNIDEQWNTLEFEDPVACPNGFMLAVSYNGFVGLGTDSGTDPEWPFVPNAHYYASPYTSGSFSTFESAGFTVNAMIRAEGEGGKKISHVPTQDKEASYPAPILVKAGVPVYTGDPYPQDRGTRDIVGYKLWRLLPGQEEDPGSWSTLTNSPVPATEYYDFSWTTAAAGIYKWAVRTCYHMGVESDPAFSNDVEKIITTQYTINVSTNSGDSPAGAEVTLSNSSNTYQGTVDVNQVIFHEVVLGDYELEVKLNGYKTYEADFSITETGVHLAILIEIIKDPFGLAIDIDDCAALFTWDHELAGGKHLNSFTVYLDGDVVGVVKNTEYLFTGLQTGNYTAGVAANYSSGASEIVTIDFEIKTCIGIDENDLGYRIYPNPAATYLIIERETSDFATIDIYNAMGMHVATYETTEVKYEISVTNLSVGTYFIRVTEGTNSSVKSFVKN